MVEKGEVLSIYPASKTAPYFKEAVMINLVGLLLARAYILEGAMPFGIAFFGAVLLNRRSPLPVFLTVVLGIISIRGMTASYKYIVMLLMLYAATYIVLRKKELKRHIVSIAAIFSVLCVSLVWLNLYGGYTLYDVFTAGFEALAAGILVYIFDAAMPVLSERGNNTGITRETAICAAVTLTVAVIGLGSLRMWHLSVRTVVLSVIILVSGYTGGATAGSAMGALLGVTSGIVSTRTAAVIGVLSFAGLLAGTFKELGKAGSILGFVIGSATLNFYLGGAGPVIIMEELLASSLLFGIIPGRSLKDLSRACGASSGLGGDRSSYSTRAKEMTSIRLKEFSNVFGQLAVTFNGVSFKEDFADSAGINRLFDGICDKVCKKCSFYKTCWDREFFDTYQALFSLLSCVEEKGRVEVKHMPAHLRKRCIKPDSLIEAINYLFVLYRINYKWQLKMEDCRNLVSQQLEGVANVIENLAGEIDMELKFNESLEQSIYTGLGRQGVKASNIVVLEKPGKRLEIHIDKKSCYGCRECIKKIIPVIEGVTRKKFNKPGYVCNIKENICSLKLVESQRFNVTTGVCGMPKEEGQVSGDNYSFMELKEHKYLVALSDGMGTGAQASMESSITINMLEQLLEVGYDHEMAVRTINSIQMLKSPDDSFSTLDMVLIDLYTGEAKIIKTGAPPTYVKRGDEVRTISSSSLPVGIVDRVQFHTKKMTMVEGDFIVMVTDGIVDACKTEGQEDWIVETLKGTSNRNPQEIARIIFEKAVSEYEGNARDDMTVLVSKVWENI